MQWDVVTGKGRSFCGNLEPNDRLPEDLNGKEGDPFITAVVCVGFLFLLRLLLLLSEVDRTLAAMLCIKFRGR